MRRLTTLLLAVVLLTSFCPLPLPVDKGAVIEFKATAHDFGKFRHDIVRACVFTFVNQGSAPLVVQSVTTACACTTVKYTRQPVLPGSKGYISVYFDGRKYPAGHFHKTVDVRSNATNGLVRLTIEGTSL